MVWYEFKDHVIPVQFILCTACICAWDCHNLGTELFTRPCWTSGDSHQPPLTSIPLPQGPSGWHSFPSVLTTPDRLVLSVNLLNACSIPLSIINKAVKLCQSQYWSLKNATHHRFLLGHQVFDHNSLNTNIQPVPYSPCKWSTCQINDFTI